MKITILFLAILVVQTSIYAQLFGPQQIITSNASTVRMVRAADLDNDGDIDVISASFDIIAWYENLDGLGTFGTQKVIGSGLQQSFSVHASDLNGDNDIDIIGTSFDNGTVFWFENLDGQGNFGSMQIIGNTAIGPDDVIAADIDGDNDMDVVLASDIDNVVAWYENLDGLGNFSAEQIITTTATNGRSIQAADIDNDTDLDIVSSSSGTITIAWFENTDGNGTFGTEQIIAGSNPAVEAIFVIDLDGDDDPDILSATNGENKISWHENLDGLGNFGTQQIITTNAISAQDVYADDLDNDNDVDVLSASFTDNKIAWYENLDGNGNFGTQQVIFANAIAARSVYTTDIDDDGDMDVISASQNDNTIAWYENLTILSIEETPTESIGLYPNPVNEILYIKNLGTLQLQTITLYDALGRKLLYTASPSEAINIAHLSSGLLFVQLVTNEGRVVTKVVKE